MENLVKSLELKPFVCCALEHIVADHLGLLEIKFLQIRFLINSQERGIRLRYQNVLENHTIKQREPLKNRKQDQ